MTRLFKKLHQFVPTARKICSDIYVKFPQKNRKENVSRQEQALKIFKK